MVVLVDASVLCRLARRDDPRYGEVYDAIVKLMDGGHQLLVTPQVEREFWVVATRPRDQNGLGINAMDADRHLRACRAFAEFRADTAAVHMLWRRLVVRHGIVGKAAHDAALVATAHAHEIDAILTLNSPDFARYQSEVAVLQPETVMRGAIP